MFEPDRGRKAMLLAYQQAARFRSEYLLPEHIFLGLVLEGNGVQANALKNLGVDLDKLQIEIEKILQPGNGADKVAMGKLPISTAAKRVI